MTTVGKQTRSDWQSALVVAFLLLIVVGFAFDGWQFLHVSGGDHAPLRETGLAAR